MLVDTVDFAFGTRKSSTIREAIETIKAEQERQAREKASMKRKKRSAIQKALLQKQESLRQQEELFDRMAYSQGGKYMSSL